MNNNIELAVYNYTLKANEIMSYINGKSDLTMDEIIKSGEELATLDYKISMLQFSSNQP